VKVGSTGERKAHPSKGISVIDLSVRGKACSLNHLRSKSTSGLLTAWSYGRNPRKNDAVVDRMCSSIREFGFKIPVLARSDGEVVDGHLRIKAARKLRIAEIPVILCDEWSAAQVKAFRLMVNRSVSWASWDEELLALELHELNETDFDLSLTGFDDAELVRLMAAECACEGLTDEDAIPESPEVPTSLPADLWNLGDHKLLVGDATDRAAINRLMAGDATDLVFTDPPYNVAYDGYTEDKLTIQGDRMAPEQFRSFLEATFGNYRQVVKAGASLCLSSVVFAARVPKLSGPPGLRSVAR
jgi:hypothetical protein